jgi:ABC-type multidrug transport system fused ATPase/permease subunit
LLKLSWQATLASLIFFGIIGVSFRRVTRVFNNLGITLIKREEGISTFIMETLLGMKLIKTFLMEKVRHEQQEEQNREVADTLEKQQFYKKRIDPSIELIVLLVLGILLTFLILYGKDFSYDLPLLITFLIILMRLKQVVSMMLGKIGELGGLAGGTKNVVDLLGQEEVVIEDGDYICPSPVKKIEFRNVSFSYNGKKVLENISLQINKGETVAIVGKSGAGKSTLVDLLLNLYQPKHGDILIDGQFTC